MSNFPVITKKKLILEKLFSFLNLIFNNKKQIKSIKEYKMENSETSELNFTLILDRGHGNINSEGVYTTSPYKMHKFKNGIIVYEGVENAKYVKALAKEGKKEGFTIKYTIHPDDPRDISLEKRIEIANKIGKEEDSLFISVHNNASKFHNARGSELYTSRGNTSSDIYGEVILEEWKLEFPNRKIRVDKSDGDLDKEANFRVLMGTIKYLPSVLLEIGFFDNITDLKWLRKEDNINRIAKSTIRAIKNQIINNKNN